MSLSAHERQVLHTIEEQLSCSDPKLVSLLAIFTRLTSGEEMPIREKNCAGWWRVTRHQPASRRPRPDSPRHYTRQLQRRIGWQQAMLLLWLIAAIALTATAVALSREGGKAPCNQPVAVNCAGKPSTHRPHAAAGTLPRLPPSRRGIRADIAAAG